MSEKIERKGEVMRLDKYLKVSRLIKRRTVANEACDAGRILVNDKVAKASTKIKVGDVIDTVWQSQHQGGSAEHRRDIQQGSGKRIISKFMTQIIINRAGASYSILVQHCYA